MAYDITFIPGDGVGPEVIEAARRTLEATGVKFNWELAIAGDSAQDGFGTPLPEYLLDSIRRTKVAFKGPITTPVGSGFRSVNVAIRMALNLYACVRPCKSYPGVRSKYQGIDLVIIRENTEGFYTGIEYEKGTPEAKRFAELVAETHHQTIAEDAGISIKTISVTGSERIVRFAFNYARANGRRKVTAVHKANILKFSDGLFLSTAREVAKKFPDIEFEDVIVDNMNMQLVRRPEHYDILVLPNLYGDILSDVAAGLVGGLGLAPTVNIGDNLAVFETTHGSAPKYAGQNKVNPLAMMFSGMLMLKHIGEREAADRLERALTHIIAEGKSVTYDLKENRDDPTAVGTSQVADAVIEVLKEEAKSYA